MRHGNPGQTRAELRKPLIVVAGQTQRQREAHGLRAHGRQVTQIHEQSTLPQKERICIRQKVHTLLQHVHRDGQLSAGAQREQRTVIANCQRHLGHCERQLAPIEMPANDLEFVRCQSDRPQCLGSDAWS